MFDELIFMKTIRKFVKLHKFYRFDYDVCNLYRSPAASYEHLITVVIAHLCTIHAQKNFLHYPQEAQATLFFNSASVLPNFFMNRTLNIA